MLLPTKGVSSDRALLTVAARLAGNLHRPMSVTALWDWHSTQYKNTPREVTFDWFALSLAVAHALGLVAMNTDGLLERSRDVLASA
ncbi:MAG: hypothetical protein FWD11_07770 [Micrococcales bacterium]|nr:hypothetical protein [Micrococcales bacterium]